MSKYDFNPFTGNLDKVNNNASEINIADAGSIITATEVETALQENRTAIDLNTTHSSSDGTDHTYIDQDLQVSASPTFVGLTLSGTVTQAYTFVNATGDEEAYKITSTDNVAQTANMHRSFVVSHAVSAAKSSTASVEGISSDIALSAATVSVYGYGAYISESGNNAHGNIFGMDIYLEDMGSGGIANLVGLNIGINSTHTATSRHTGLRIRNHSGTATDAIIIESAFVDGLDLSGGTFSGADIRLQNGETIDNSTDGAIKISGNFIPNADSSLDLGTSSLYWANAYIDKVYLNATATIDGATAGVLNVVGNLTSPGAGTYSEKFGLNAVTAGSSGVAIGRDASAAGNYSTAVGRLADAGGGSAVAIGLSATADGNFDIAIGKDASLTSSYIHCVAIGYAATATGNNAVAIGSQATAAVEGVAIGMGASSSHQNAFALGRGATSTAARQVIFGSETYNVTNMYLGEGVTSTTPAAFTIQTSGGSGTDIAGGNLQLAGGKGTGAGAGGSIVFQTAPAGASGTTLRSLVTRLTIDSTGLITLADAVDIAVNTTTGTKIGTATGQKLGFFNATPVVQQAYTAVSDPPTQAEVTAIRDALVNLGLMASS